jgi:hypothetical protein
MKPPNTVRSPDSLTVLVCGGPDYTDECTLFDTLDRLLWECEDRGLRMVVVQGAADGADAMAREWAVLDNEIGSQVELITDPNYFVTCRL